MEKRDTLQGREVLWSKKKPLRLSQKMCWEAVLYLKASEDAKSVDRREHFHSSPCFNCLFHRLEVD